MANANVDMKQIRHDILTELQEKRSASTAVSSRDGTEVRGEACLELVKQNSVVQTGRFNDMTDFDIEVVPGVILEDLQDFNESVFDGKMTVEKIENKCIKLTIPDEEEGGENHTIVKVKFFKLDDARTRVRFIRKTGDM